MICIYLLNNRNNRNEAPAFGGNRRLGVKAMDYNPINRAICQVHFEPADITTRLNLFVITPMRQCAATPLYRATVAVLLYHVIYY